jgi:hypothetical protein
MPDRGQPIGLTFRRVGDACPCAESGFVFAGTRTGRANQDASVTAISPLANGGSVATRRVPQTHG